MENNNTYAIITGSSAGMGKEMARELAKRGKNVVLVALANTGLPEYAQELGNTYKIEVKNIEIDLTLPDSPAKILEMIKKDKLSIDMLINNAGIGYPGRFEVSDMKRNELMMNLNMFGTTRMTHTFLPELKRQDKSYLLNVASVAAFYPTPFKPIYASTKSYILSFTVAMREEMKNSPVSISVLCPGGVMTNESCRERIEIQGGIAKLSTLYPEDVAKYTIKRLLKGKAVIVPGAMNKFFRLMSKVVPLMLLEKILYKVFQKDEKVINKEKTC